MGSQICGVSEEESYDPSFKGPKLEKTVGLGLK
jgi:hypothetical protein